jgi:serine protease Do
VAQDLSSEGHVVRAGLGAEVRSLDNKTAESFGLLNAEGALLAGINKGSAAEKAGLLANDVVVEFNGERVTNSTDLVARLYTKTPGDSVKMGVLRKGKRIEVTAVLQALADASSGPMISGGGAGDSSVLGFSFRDLTDDERAQAGGNVPQGPVVDKLDPKGPAARAGLQPGDLVVKVGDQAIPNTETLTKVLKDSNLKKGVRMFIWRNGVTLYGFLQSAE